MLRNNISFIIEMELKKIIEDLLSSHIEHNNSAGKSKVPERC